MRKSAAKIGLCATALMEDESLTINQKEWM